VRATEGEKGGLPRPEPEDPRNVEEQVPAADAVVWNEVARLQDGEPYLLISVARNCPLAARDELDRKGTVNHSG
jgi:hypothetical protein